MDIRAGYKKGKEDADIMYAKMYNGSINKMKYLTEGSRGADVVNSGDLITAALFNSLRSYAINDMKLNYNQCNNCNVGCDVICNSCNAICESNQCNTPTTCCDHTPQAG